MSVITAELEWSEVGQVGVLRLNRPDKLNALTSGMLDQIWELCASVRRRGDIKAVALLGNGRSFCAGHDMGERDDARSLADSLAGSIIRDAQTALAELPQPTVAGLHGHALGRGLMLALACDLRLAADGAKLGLPEIKYGMIPGGGGTHRLTRIIGPARALQMVLTGDPIDANRALDWGLVTSVVAADEIEPAVMQVAQQIAGTPGQAAAFAKTAVRMAVDTTIRDGIIAEKALSAVARTEPAWRAAREAREARPRPTGRDGRT